METISPQADQEPSDAGNGNFTHLLKLRVPVVIRLAHKKMDVQAISKMMVGTIIEFDKSAGDELEIMIRNKPIGYGVAVRTGESYGLRITSLCDIRETIAAMASE